MREQAFERQFRVRYAILTFALFLPLIWAFVTLRSVYPVTAWTVMKAGGELGHSQTYFILRGETISGELVDIAPITLTDALYARIWGMVDGTVNNRNFKLRSLHPDNAALLERAGNIVRLPRVARLPELLRAWGHIYNSKLPASAPLRLKAIRLDAYRWMGQHYADYDNFIETWREEL